MKVDVNITIDCEKTLSEAMQSIPSNFTDVFGEPESLSSVMAAMTFMKEYQLGKTFMECLNLVIRNID